VRSAAETDLSVLRQFNPDSVREWRCVYTTDHNVLIEGPDAAMEAILLVLEPRLRRPVMRKRSQAPFEAPTGEVGGLILQGVAALRPEDQAGLLAWLDRGGSRARILSTTEQPLFPLVAASLFDAALYYRLNVMLVRVEPRENSRVPATDAERARSLAHESLQLPPRLLSTGDI
jgi:Sigma-54 interaction domain